LSLEFVGTRVVCPECGAECSMKDHAAERRWRHLDAMQFQTTLTARVPRCSCDRCGVKTISVPWAEKQRSKVKAVCMDKWQAYETSTERNVPQARIVHDRFHVAKSLNEAVDKVRRTEHRELQQGGDDRLKGVRQILLFNPENVGEEKDEELAAMRKSTLATGRAWSLKELFRFFWQETDAVGGRAFFQSWYASAIRGRFDPVRKVARMLKTRLDRILTWFASPISNGVAEGFNSRIQSIESAACGFRIFEHYRIRILFYCDKLNLKLSET